MTAAAGAGSRRAGAFAAAWRRARRWTAARAHELLIPCLALVFLSLHAAAAAAQDPRPQQRDTVPARTDSIPADTLPGLEQEPDTVVQPAVQFPLLPQPAQINVAGTEWVWDREMLLREADVSLVELLERIPGVTRFRAGMFVQPEVASAFGGTAARTEIEIDGYHMDPLSGSSFDLSQLALGHLREVRVQRRLGVLRILLTTEYPIEGLPYTRVEAGIGVPAANHFRGLFLVPHVIIGPLSLGIERLDTDGTGRDEPAGLFSGWARWAYTSDTRGIQIEWMRGTLRREANSPWPIERIRQDFVLRARNQFTPSFVAELFAGRSSMDETVPGAGVDAQDVRTERQSLQAGVRAGFRSGATTLGASARYRSLDDLPVGEARLDAETVAGPLRLSADAAVASWDGADPVTGGGLRAEIGGLFSSERMGGAAAFGEITRGTRGAPVFADSLAFDEMRSFRDGWRAGVSLDLGRASGSVAVISLDQDWAWPFGLEFDRTATPEAIGTLQGIEAHGRVIVWPDLLTLDSWITDWREAEGWTYLPSRSWRTALELHTLPLESGNLEIFARAEAHMRGSVLTFDPSAEGGPAYTRLPAYTTADGYLQIRVIDVRAFIRWEDMLGNIEELPGRIQRGPRIFYGVKWNLWN